MRHRGNSAGVTGRIRDLTAGVWRQSYKVYRESVFLYNNKKPKATRAVVYTKHGDIASLANRFLTRQGDKTEERAQEGVGSALRAKRRGDGERFFSQHKPTGRSWSHAGTHARMEEARGQRCVPVLAVRGEGMPGACICLPQISGFLLFRLQPTRGFWV